MKDDEKKYNDEDWDSETEENWEAKMSEPIKLKVIFPSTEKPH